MFKKILQYKLLSLGLILALLLPSLALLSPPSASQGAAPLTPESVSTRHTSQGGSQTWDSRADFAAGHFDQTELEADEVRLAHAWQPSVKVNNEETLPHNQFDASIVVGSDGTLYMAWEDERNDDGDIYFAKSTDGGETWSENQKVNQDTGTAQQRYPHLVIDSDDTLYLVWSDERNGENNDDIYLAKSTNGGTTWSASTRVSDDTGSAEQHSPRMVVDSGTVYLVWHDHRNGNWDIFFAKSPDGGESWPDGNQQVNDENASTQVWPTLAIVGDTVYVAWEDYRADRDGDIYFTKSSDGGETWDNIDVSVHSTGHRQDRPDLVADTDGDLYLAWRDTREGNEIYFASSSDGGETWPTLARVNDTLTNAQDTPRLAVFGNTIYAAWRDSRNGTYDVYFAKSTDGGANWIDHKKANDNVGANEYLTSMAIDANGYIYLAWSDERDGASIDNSNRYDDIFFTKSTDDGANWTVDVRVNDDVGGTTAQYDPNLAIADDGTYYLTWEDYRRGNSDIYFSSSTDGQNWLLNRRVTNDSGAAPQYNPTLVVDSNTLYMAWDDEPYYGHEDIFFAKSTDEGITWGSNILINDDNSGRYQGSPTLAATSNSLYLAWQDARNGNGDIYFARSLDGGDDWDANIMVNDGGGRQWGSSIALAADGTIYLAWIDERNGNSDDDIYFAKSTNQGVDWTPNIKVNDNTNVSEQHHPNLLLISNTLYLVWHDHRNGNWDIYFSKSSDGGTSWSPNIKLNDDTGTTEQSWPILGANAEGTLYAVWEDQRNEHNKDIYLAYSYDDGETWSANVRVDDAPELTEQTRPTLAIAPNGSPVVAWEDARDDDGDIRISRPASTYEASGTYTSPIHDAGDIVTWQSLEWNDTVPANSSLELAVRVGNLATPDENWTDWVTVSDSGNLSALPPSQYLQWRATFNTSNANVSASLDNVTLMWESFSVTVPASSISGNTTWTAADSPYLLTSSALVNQGATLTIEPGTTIWMGDGRHVQVEGTLVVEGSAAQRVRFTSWHTNPQAGDWTGLRFVDSSTDGTVDGDGAYLSGSLLQYAVIEYGGGSEDEEAAGLVRIESAAPLISKSVIRHSASRGIVNEGGVGLRVQDSTIADNQDGGIYNNGSEVVITRNTISGNVATTSGGGILNNLGPAEMTNNTLEDNHATENGGGIANLGSEVMADGNRLTDNSAAVQGGAVYWQGDGGSLSYNTILNNSASENSNELRIADCGLRIADCGNSEIRNPKSEIPSAIHLGSGYPQINFNELQSSSGITLYNSNPYDDGTTTLDATQNFWGTTNEVTIEAAIYDRLDDDSLSVVNYSPILTTTAPNLEPSNKVIIPAEAHPGVTVDYVITLFNQAPEQANQVALTDTLPTELSMIAGSLTGGATYNANTRRISWQGAVLAGEEKKIQLQAVVDESVDTGTTISSTAYASGDGLNGTKAMPATLSTANLMRISLAADRLTELNADVDGSYIFADISADGEYIGFQTVANNLLLADMDDKLDIYVIERRTGKLELVSIASDGSKGNGDSFGASFSENGRFVAFHSAANNLVTDDTNGRLDVFLHDRQTGETELISRSNDSTQGNNDSRWSKISLDGRYVLFESEANNLVPGDNNGQRDIFLYDHETQTIKRVNLSNSGIEANGFSGWTSLSGDGRYVSFASDANNLVPKDTNGQRDVFLYEVESETISRLSVSSEGEQGNLTSDSTFISADGRYVGFKSAASNLVPQDSNGAIDIFVHDWQKGTTSRVSVASDGIQGNGDSDWPSISADGRYVVFHSLANNLVSGDSNQHSDIFIHDTQTGQTERIGLSASGVQGNNSSEYPVLSGDGRYTLFSSSATNLVAGDTNGFSDLFIYDAGAQIVEAPQMALAPSQLSFIAQVNTTNPLPKQLYINRVGGGGLDYTISSDADWLTANPTAGTTPATANVSADISSLPVDTYTGQLTVNAPLAGNNPQQIAVTLVITDSALPTGDIYESDDSCGNAQAIPADGSIQAHTFHQADDHDWGYFDAEQGREYVIQAIHTSEEADMVLELYENCSQFHSEGDDIFGADVRLTFTAPNSGRYYLKTRNNDPNAYGPDVSYDLSVRAPVQGGVAVIIAGRDPAERLQNKINHIAKDAYQTFANSGFRQQNIYLLAHDDIQVGGRSVVNAEATPANLEEAITGWAVDKLAAKPNQPFYLFMVDHGGPDVFFADAIMSNGEGLVWANDLDNWLTTLEENTRASNVNIIYEACQSGSFIDGTNNIAGANRVVISSTSRELNAYASSNGAHFSDTFLTALESGYSLWASFNLAQEAVEATGLFQIPWLDDNGDALANGPNDGQLAAQRSLGAQAFGGLPPIIESISVSEPIAGEATIQATVSDDIAVGQVSAVIYPPDFVEPEPVEDGVMPELDVTTLLLTDTNGDGQYSSTYAGFTQADSYRIVIYASDEEGNQAVPQVAGSNTGTQDTQGTLYLPLVSK